MLQSYQPCQALVLDAKFGWPEAQLVYWVLLRFCPFAQNRLLALRVSPVEQQAIRA
jgi:hypothetical protein